jgi:hypothetical protein
MDSEPRPAVPLGYINMGLTIWRESQHTSSYKDDFAHKRRDVCSRIEVVNTCLWLAHIVGLAEVLRLLMRIVGSGLIGIMTTNRQREIEPQRFVVNCKNFAHSMYLTIGRNVSIVRTILLGCSHDSDHIFLLCW